MHAVFVALLTISASGAWSLVVAEPCTGYELPGTDDGACPPTCVTCGCCAQAAEPTTLDQTTSPDIAVANLIDALRPLLKTDPRDILHVPRLGLL